MEPHAGGNRRPQTPPAAREPFPRLTPSSARMRSTNERGASCSSRRRLMTPCTRPLPYPPREASTGFTTCTPKSGVNGQGAGRAG